MTVPDESLENNADDPDVSGWLLAYLDAHRGERFDEIESGADDSSDGVIPAAKILSKYAYQMLLSGETPPDLDDALRAYLPGLPVSEKATDLLRRNYLYLYLEFEVAYDVVFRLVGTRDRLSDAVAAFSIVQDANAPLTVIKYLQRLVSLYLAGYEGEMIFLCGAALESALEHRFSDELLHDHRYKPKWFGDKPKFSVGQRMACAKKTFALTDGAQSLIWEILNARNDFAHVQPDIGPPAREALYKTAICLTIILPTERFAP